MRELTAEELNQVSGGWLGETAGAVVGGLVGIYVGLVYGTEIGAAVGTIGDLAGPEVGVFTTLAGAGIGAYLGTDIGAVLGAGVGAVAGHFIEAGISNLIGVLNAENDTTGSTYTETMNDNLMASVGYYANGAYGALGESLAENYGFYGAIDALNSTVGGSGWEGGYYANWGSGYAS
jgi:bacteriocin-like protein